MAEEEAVFDDWQEEAQIQLTKQPKEQPVKEEVKVEAEVKESLNQVQEQKKVEIVDPQKIFNQRLTSYKQINEDKFQAYFQNLKEQSTNQQIVISNQILKNDKDFAQFAKKVVKKLNDVLNEAQAENLEDERVYDFFEEIVFLVYNQLEWKNIESTKDKLKIVKKQKKDEDAKIRKQKEKQQRMKKQIKQTQGQVTSPSKEKKEEDDIFGGATLVNSKQIEEQIKAKGFEKVQAKKVEVVDDDDFM